MASPQQPIESRLLQAVLHEARPRVLRLLERFAILPDEAVDVVADAQLALLYKGRSVAWPVEWLVYAVKRRCLRIACDRRDRLCRVLDTAVLDLLEVSGDDGDLASLDQDIARNLSALPRSSRSLLERRYRRAEPGVVRRAAADLTDPRLARAVRLFGRQLIGLAGPIGPRHPHI